MLRIAVPNKGSLSEPAIDMLREAGYRVRRDAKELVVHDTDNDVEFFYLRPRDIAVYVGSGTVDCGLTGRDLLLDSGSGAIEVLRLGFGGSPFRYAARPGTCRCPVRPFWRKAMRLPGPTPAQAPGPSPTSGSRAIRPSIPTFSGEAFSRARGQPRRSPAHTTGATGSVATFPVARAAGRWG